jgi:endonuclease YncB( thermonuclease family)
MKNNHNRPGKTRKTIPKKVLVIYLLLAFALFFGLSRIALHYDNIHSRTAQTEAQALSVNNQVLKSVENESRLDGPYKVVRVVDGDTVILDIDGVDERVRLIGIDTPEAVHPDPARNVLFGKIASAYTKSMLDGKDVMIELDIEERDQYGRLLAYVYINGDMFNKSLLEGGYAKVTTYPPNVKYVDQFIVLQKKAREAGKGLWED